MADEEQTPLHDVTPPDVTMLGSAWPKQITGELPAGPPAPGQSVHVPPNSAHIVQGPPPAPVPVVPEFSVVLSPFFDAQNALAAPLLDSVTAYQALKDMTNERKDWVFSKEHDGPLGQTDVPYNAAREGRGTGSTPKNIAPHPELVKVAPEMKAALDNGLLAIADTLYLVGEYIAMLNTVPQVYTNADKKSFVPTD